MKWYDFLDSPRRFTMTLLALLAVLFVLMVAATTIRIVSVTGGDEPASAPSPTASPVNTDLVPPTPQITDAATPAVDYGDAAPVLLESLQAWLDQDMQKFSRLATPEVVEAAHDAPAPAPGQEILSSPEVTEPGPTQATYRVNTTDGWMDIVMVVSQDKSPAGWVIADMEYVR